METKYLRMDVPLNVFQKLNSHVRYKSQIDQLFAILCVGMVLRLLKSFVMMATLMKTNNAMETVLWQLEAGIAQEGAWLQPQHVWKCVETVCLLTLKVVTMGTLKTETVVLFDAI